MSNKVLASLLACLPLHSLAQEEVSLDSLDTAPKEAPKPAPAAPRHGALRAGDVNFSLFFDGYLEVVAPKDPDAKGTFEFGQEHQSLLARASTSDGISAFGDVAHWTNVFEATVPLKFFAPSLEGVPALGESSLRFGRILVPMGNYAVHPIYGGSVKNSELLLAQFWSDYGASFKTSFGHALEAEVFAVNGVSISERSDTAVQLKAMNEDNNRSKAVGGRVRFSTQGGLTLCASYMHDATTTPELGERGDSAFAVGLDLVGLDGILRTGPLTWKAGYLGGWVRSDGFADYRMDGWYAEARWRLDERWSLRMRGGQVDPDDRTKDGNDQTDVNASILWNKGPLDVGLTWYHNVETYRSGRKSDAGNHGRIRLETFVAL